MFARFLVRPSVVLLGAIVITSCSPSSSSTGTAPNASASAADADWVAYNRTLPGDRFAPLAEIDRTNVGQMKQICMYTLPEVSSLQTGPLVVGGTMYFTTDEGSYAIDAGTCAEKWKTTRKSETPSFLLVNRGFAYMNGRLFRGTSDSHVIALDSADGRQIWDHLIDEKGPGVSIPMAPIAANGLVFVGNAGGDQVDVTGHVYALDAADGHVVWKFDVVPAAGPASSTWTNKKLPVSAAPSGPRSPSMKPTACSTSRRAIRRLISTSRYEQAITSIRTL